MATRHRKLTDADTIDRHGIWVLGRVHSCLGRRSSTILLDTSIPHCHEVAPAWDGARFARCTAA
jgi:hypothetical protein